MSIKDLYKTLQERKSADPEESYVAKMHKKGTRKIAQKIGEETAELIIDAVRLDEKPESTKRRQNVIEESADLLFHYTLLLAHHDISIEEVYKALEKRKGKSGLKEKQEREN